MHFRRIFRFAELLFFLLLIWCSPSQAQSDRFLELFPRKDLDRTLVAVNAFGNQPGFGSLSDQYTEIRNTLGITHVRVLFAWSDQVQPTPNSSIDFSFYDDIIKSLPRKTRALVVIANLPSWMNDDSNWIKGNPRLTFYKKWVRKLVRRYRRKRKIVGFQIFNEPNNESFSENYVFSTIDSPENYLELLKRSHRYIKRRAKRKKVVAAATTSIFQNFPETLNYNEALHSLGIEQHCDVFGLHVYGSSLERYYLGIGDFLSSIELPIWVTESGEQGVLKQLEYVERVWPFLSGEHPSIKRFYYYRFTDVTEASSAFGLKTLSLTNPVSDLYVYLRDGDGK